MFVKLAILNPQYALIAAPPNAIVWSIKLAKRVATRRRISRTG
jgi:hypothetical protein